MPRRALLLSAAVFAAPLGAMAEEGRHADAHVHGVSVLQIAVEGASVAMELRAPGADIVGFEHAAQADADKDAVEAALTLLRDPVALFGLAGCTADEIEAHVDIEGEDHAGHGHEDKHEDHDAHAHEGEHHDELLSR